MSKEELENAIKNGDSVWVVDYDEVIEKNASSLIQLDNKFIELDEDGYFRSSEYFFKTQAEAQHYLDHANITRTEELPFATWEEFIEEYSFEFIEKSKHLICMYWNDIDGIVIQNIDTDKILYKSDLTEENFYKAYDECVKLFKGVENE